MWGRYPPIDTFPLLCGFPVQVASKVMRLNTSIADGNRFLSQIYPTSAFLITNILKYVIIHTGHRISVRRCWIAVHTLHVRNFLLLDMREVILNSFAREKKGALISAVQEIRVGKIMYCSPSESVSRDYGQYAWLGAITAYLLTESALGNSCGHFESVD
jgi:hypothetical protein